MCPLHCVTHYNVTYLPGCVAYPDIITYQRGQVSTSFCGYPLKIQEQDGKSIQLKAATSINSSLVVVIVSVSSVCSEHSDATMSLLEQEMLFMMWETPGWRLVANIVWLSGTQKNKCAFEFAASPWYWSPASKHTSSLLVTVCCTIVGAKGCVVKIGRA